MVDNNIKNYNILLTNTLNYFKVLIFSSLLGSLNFILPFIPASILGFNLSGYSWLLVFFVSVYYLLRNLKSKFPLQIWISWVILLTFYIILDFSFVGLQGTIQFLVPILVGFVTGGLKYNKITLLKIVEYFKYLMILTILSSSVLSFIRFGVFGVSPATDAHLTALSGVIVLTFFYHTHKYKYIFYYGLLTLMPILAVTRTGIVVMLLLPFLHFYKFFSFRKIILIIIFIPLSIYIFYLPSIQEKMFFNGKGNFNDLNFKNENVVTSGRSTINEILIKEFNKNQLFGNGPRTDYFILKKYKIEIQEAHNDYLQILSSYGLLGGIVLLFSFIFLIQFVIKLKTLSINERIIKSIFLTLLIPLVLFMATDTVLRMTYSFINYLFAVVGIFLSIHFTNKKILKYNYENNSSYPII